MSTMRCLETLTAKQPEPVITQQVQQLNQMIIEDYQPALTLSKIAIQDARTQAEKQIDDGFYKVRKRSASSWQETFFEYAETAAGIVRKSYHDVKKIIRKGELAFLKLNATNSPISELETTMCQFYRIFAPDLIPKSHTVYREFDQATPTIEAGIIGVASKAMPGFKPIQEDPLKPEDIVIEALNARTVTVTDLKAIYKLYQQQQAYKLTDKPDNEILSFNLPDKVVQIKASDLKHFEIIRAAAMILVLSYFFEEDDLHCGNLSKYGRIDFDMSLWPILHHFKNLHVTGILDRKAREPSLQQFIITEKDITQFPVLTDASPYHWPAFCAENWLKYIARLGTATVSTLTSPISYFTGKTYITSNAYTSQMNSAYSQLATNEVFEEIKYDLFTELCMTPPEAYQAIAAAEINDAVQKEDSKQSVIQDITDHLRSRIQHCQNVLAGIPKYRTYLANKGTNTLMEFLEKMEKRNQEFDARLAKRNIMNPLFQGEYPEFIKQKMDLARVNQCYLELESKCQAITHDTMRARKRLQGTCSF